MNRPEERPTDRYRGPVQSDDADSGTPGPTSCIALVGAMGSGKSTVAAVLAARTGRRLVDLDEAIVADAGASIADIFATEGEAGFRERERRALAAALDLDEPLVVATGGGAVTDAGSRRLLVERAVVVWLVAAPDVLVSRIGDPSTRPLLAGDDPVGALRDIVDARRALYDEVADLRVDVTEATADEVAATVLDLLGVAA